MNKTVFLDRDNTLNFDREGHIYETEKFELMPNVIEGLKIIQELGYKLVIITNQSGINSGYYTVDDYKKFNNHLIKMLRNNGIRIDSTYYCPHTPDEDCKCRKPKPGLIIKAANELDIDLKSSWMIGDKITDIKAGKFAGCKTILVNNEDQENISNYRANNLEEAAKIVENELFPD